MAAAKTERLLNLVICLLYTRRPLTKSQIRQAVAAYAQTAGDEAFDRMFERDKDELRSLGIPLLTEPVEEFFEDEPGYRIDRREYALPYIDFAPDELALLGLAGRTWAQASLAGPAAQALRKLRADGVERDTDSLVGVEPRVRTTEPAFDAARRAVVDAYPIRFSYRAARTGEVTHRHVQPWGIAAWHGRWYLTGFDLDREATRVFRLGRIEGAVSKAGAAGSYDIPADHEPRKLLARQARDGEPVTARLRLKPGAGHALRRRAQALRPEGHVAHLPSRVSDWDCIEFAALDIEILADELAGFGPDVYVEEPPTLRAAVVRRWRAAARSHQEDPS